MIESGYILAVLLPAIFFGVAYIRGIEQGRPFPPRAALVAIGLALPVCWLALVFAGLTAFALGRMLLSDFGVGVRDVHLIVALTIFLVGSIITAASMWAVANVAHAWLAPKGRTQK